MPKCTFKRFIFGYCSYPHAQFLFFGIIREIRIQTQVKNKTKTVAYKFLHNFTWLLLYRMF